MQHKITAPSDLLDPNGKLIQTGYATTPLLRYNRENAAYKLRLKEWDYYLLYNEESAFALTVGNTSNFLLISASIIDLKNGKEQSKSAVKYVPKFYLPATSLYGDIVYKDNTIDLSILHVNEDRKISLYIRDFMKGSDLTASLLLMKEPKDSMVIATPFKENQKFFYYNQKIIGMNASGYVQLKDTGYSYLPYSSFGLLDWGRGIWPHKTTWYWSAAQGYIADNIFGFNLGCGFGDTKNATENMLFLNGTASKLTKVKFQIPKDKKNRYDYLKPWLITTEDNRLDLTFSPIYDRKFDLSAVILATNQNQVFGKFTGTAVFDDGRTVYIHDFLGFAEHVKNKW
ncbi:DUF2804 domain-containing protein [Anaerocolumna sp. AGMB13025]|uniref:DUF2804 domain-containing protein n=1 Tax=Anaerocolumna sp. AGMB13025 TaxID=3039116 RepID=UPI00241DCC48|nr:DUF2804 domain-containing protein [Anaerocolumna sp. AGMB13025]WFR57051.1 DUF2804 domain-containing protein [Anaerocolumna sp. AGMB13025]